MDSNLVVTPPQFASLGRSLNTLDPDKGMGSPLCQLTVSLPARPPPQLTITHTHTHTLFPSEEEEDEEEDSDDECQELTLPADSSGLGEESLEPPAKLARTDPRGLFGTSHTDN